MNNVSIPLIELLIISISRSNISSQLHIVNGINQEIIIVTFDEPLPI